MNETPENVVLRLRAALVARAAIDYGTDIQDKEFPELIWSRYGLPASNEIIVTATIGEVQIGIAAPSSLMWPAMIDRIFGMDVSDAYLSSQLSEQLWLMHGNRLAAEIWKVRGRSN